MEIGDRIRGLREDRDLYQKDIAKLLQTSQSYYAQYENNKRPIPSEHIKTLALFYKVSADYILGLPKNMHYPQY